MLKHKGTYEIISPEDIGLSRSSESGIVLGKHRYEMIHVICAKLMPFACIFLFLSFLII